MDMKQISCPRCGQKTVYSPQNPYRPFCSERCQMIDLGNWAEGNYKVPGKSQELSNHEETELDPNSKEEDSDPNS